MNKAELVNAVADKTGLTKADSEKALKAVIGEITGSLKKGETVQLIGFGSFSVSKRAKRQGINPKTGEKITIPATKVVKFKAGKALKDTVNSKK